MKKKILIAEDEFQIRNYIGTTLELNNYETIYAENGYAALQLAQKHIPDLIISDIMMPILNGFDLLRELQKNKDTANIPLLFLSARSDKDDVRLGMNLGADDYLSKPFDIDELIKAVQSQLKKHKRRDSFYQEQFDELRTNIRLTLPHEIRTPLSIILGYSDILLKKDYQVNSEDAKEMISHINSSAKRLNHLFENYLLLANLEIIASDIIEKDNLLKNCTLSTKSIIFDISYNIASGFRRNTDLVVDIEDSAISIAERYLIKAIEEIISNAFKFSEKNSLVTIKCRKKNQQYIISVQDHGRGLSSKQIADIGAYIQFERRLYEQQGLGLGAAIAKRIVELHNGKFDIRSEVGKFTEVRLSFPIASVLE